jgi:hypothetical protein
MSELGQSRSFDGVCSMSELPSKAEVDPRSCDVAKVPKGDITRIHSNTSSARPDRGNGTVIPSALAVLRFRNSSTLVDC